MVIALMLQVTLVFQDSLPIADPIVRTAVQEAAAIWAPYGLALNRAPAACDRAPSDTLLLAVDAAERVSPGRVGVVLGEVAFRPDGMPEPRVSLFLNALLNLIADTRALSLAAWQSPRALRDISERAKGSSCWTSRRSSIVPRATSTPPATRTS